MIYIGIDPALSGAMAIAAIDGDGTVLWLWSVGAQKETALWRRARATLGVLGRVPCNAACGYAQSAVCAVEQNIVHPRAGVRSALALAELIGAIKYICHQDGHDVVDIAPTQAKLALTGTGNADKATMVKMARAQFTSAFYAKRTKAENESIADALGIALAARSMALAVVSR